MGRISARNGENTIHDIIPPDIHGIDEDRLNASAISIMQTLNEAGFEAYLVGGGVRDFHSATYPRILMGDQRHTGRDLRIISPGPNCWPALSNRACSDGA